MIENALDRFERQGFACATGDLIESAAHYAWGCGVLAADQVSRAMCWNDPDDVRAALACRNPDGTVDPFKIYEFWEGLPSGVTCVRVSPEFTLEGALPRLLDRSRRRSPPERPLLQQKGRALEMRLGDALLRLQFSATSPEAPRTDPAGTRVRVRLPATLKAELAEWLPLELLL